MKTNPILAWMIYRIKHGRNTNILISGEPGIGKTYRGIRLGELLDFNGFGIGKISKSAEAFMHFLNYVVQTGDFGLWDENIGADAADWYTEGAKAIKMSMQIMREKRFTFCQCLPSVEDVLPKARKFFHVYIEPRSYSKKYDGYYCLVMRMQHNPRKRITYFKYFRCYDRVQKKFYVIKRMLIRCPQNKQLIADYEAMAKSFKGAQHIEGALTIQKEKERKAKNWSLPPDIYPHVVTVKSNLPKFVSVFQSRAFIDADKVSPICGVGMKTANRIKKEIEAHYTSPELKRLVKRMRAAEKINI
jgi:hypothetical protein